MDENKLPNEIYEQEFTFDKPVVFKELNIYPVRMKDYTIYRTVKMVLEIDKNNTNDPSVISMSYLDYLIHLMDLGTDVSKMLIQYLCFLFVIVTRDDKLVIKVGSDNKGKYLLLNDIKINKNDFKQLRKIILYQNDSNYVEENINSDLKKELDEVKRLKSKNSNNLESVSLEKTIASLVTSSCFKIDDIYEMPIRKFFIYIEMIDKKVKYKIEKSAELSGFVKFNDEVTHYLYEKKISYADMVIDADQIKSKINKTNS